MWGIYVRRFRMISYSKFYTIKESSRLQKLRHETDLEVGEPYLGYFLHKRQDCVPRLLRFLEEGEVPHFRPGLNLNVRKRLLIQLLHLVRQKELVLLP